MHSGRFRGALVLLVVGSSVGLGVLAACSDDESSGGLAPNGSDASVNVDGSTNGDRDGTVGNGNDSGANDAGADVDPYADADKDCTHYVTPPVTSPTSVKIVNNTGAPIYLGHAKASCEAYIAFAFKDETDAAIAVTTFGDTLCESYQNECPASTCPTNPVTKVENGKTFDVGWPGTVFASKYMPPSCYADAACVKGPCLQEVAAPTGTIEVTGYSAFTCPDGGASCFDCTTGVSGSCIVSGAVLVSGTTHEATATYTPGASTVTVTLQ